MSSKIKPGELIMAQLELNNKSVYDFASEMDMRLEEAQQLITGISKIDPQIAFETGVCAKDTCTLLVILGTA